MAAKQAVRHDLDRTDPTATPGQPADPVIEERASQGPSLDEIIAVQEQIFAERQPESRRLATLAATALAGGVTSSWQITSPQPVWLSHGQGSKIYDVDGHEYVDLHGGYGAALAGHGHPAIVAAIRSQAALGTHFAQPTITAIAVAQELSRRFGMPQWRFANSGTEATMDAVHLMRAITGRDLIVKVEGCYHGHHDSVQVSVCPADDDEIGPAGRPIALPSSSGIPRAITDLTLVVGFNDLTAVAALLADHPARAGLPGRPEGPAARPRGAADLRRGQDRADGRPRRSYRPDRRHPGHHLPGQGDRRRRGGGRDRRHRRGHGARHQWRL